MWKSEIKGWKRCLDSSDQQVIQVTKDPTVKKATLSLYPSRTLYIYINIKINYYFISTRIDVLRKDWSLC